MVVHYLHIVCFPVVPPEADTVLAVDADAMLALPVAVQGFQAVAGYRGQISERTSDVNEIQFAFRNRRNSSEPPRPLAREDCPGIVTTERANHAPTL